MHAYMHIYIYIYLYVYKHIPPRKHGCEFACGLLHLQDRSNSFLGGGFANEDEWTNILFSGFFLLDLQLRSCQNLLNLQSVSGVLASDHCNIQTCKHTGI